MIIQPKKLDKIKIYKILYKIFVRIASKMNYTIPSHPSPRQEHGCLKLSCYPLPSVMSLLAPASPNRQVTWYICQIKT